MNDWQNDKEYIKLFDDTLKLIGCTPLEAGIAVGRFKGYTMTKLAQYAATFKGEMAEVGSWNGGSGRLLAKTIPWKKLTVFDTFEGIPHVIDGVDPEKFKKEFSEAGIYEIAKRTLSDCSNVEMRRGVFPDTAFDLGNKHYCFVHADADVYQSTMDICKFFYPRLSPGGVIVFDDYGYEGAPGCKAAVDKFFRKTPDRHTVITGGQAIVIKGTR